MCVSVEGGEKTRVGDGKLSNDGKKPVFVEFELSANSESFVSYVSFSLLLMVFPKSLGDFDIALLSPFVAAAQKKNNRSGINRIINSVTGTMVNLQFHNTFTDITH